MDLDTEADVPGVDERQFRGYADEAKANCPVSRAPAGVPEIALTAKLIEPTQSTNGISILVLIL
jgi:lipoyl-dependent peroxiredoxin